MKFTTKGRYGLKAAFVLAQSWGGAPVSLRDIAASQQLAEKYLEQLLSSLKKAGLVETVRGAQGGYTLSREPALITVNEVIVALEGDLSIVDCQREGVDCRESGTCATKKVWKRISAAVTDALESITLQDMLQDYGSAGDSSG